MRGIGWLTILVLGLLVAPVSGALLVDDDFEGYADNTAVADLPGWSGSRAVVETDDWSQGTLRYDDYWSNDRWDTMRSWSKSSDNGLGVMFDLYTSSNISGSEMYKFVLRQGEDPWKENVTLKVYGDHIEIGTQSVNYDRTKWQTVVFADINFDNDTFDFYFGERGGTLTLVLDDASMDYAAETLYAMRCQGNTASTSMQMYVDNLKVGVGVVPEPTTMGLLLVGGVSCLMRRKR